MKASKKTVAVFFGGESVEHDVSVLTGLQFIEALDAERFQAVPVYVDAVGKWWTGKELLNRSFYPLISISERQLTPVRLPEGAGTARPQLETVKKGALGSKLIPIPFDIAISAIHGTRGEDGALQGLFEFARVPYAGCPVLGSAAAMDKWFTKRLLAGRGVPVLPSKLIEAPEPGVHLDAEALIADVRATLPDHDFPYFVKPCNLGSSIGVARVDTPEDLLAALIAIFRMDRAALVEPFVQHLVEYNVAAARIDGEVRTSAIERPKVADDNADHILDFKAKYLAGASGGPKMDDTPSEGMVSQNRILNPEELTPETEGLIRRSAIEAFEGMEMAGSVRVDFLCDSETGAIWFNEVNTIPGSFAYYLWQGAEPPLSFTALADAMIAEGFALHQRRNTLSDASAGGGMIFARE